MQWNLRFAFGNGQFRKVYEKVLKKFPWQYLNWKTQVTTGILLFFFLLYSKEALISINNFFSNSKHSRYICQPKAKYVQSRLEFLKFARCSKFDPNDRSERRAKRSVVTENPSGTIGGETPFATYLTVPRKPTSSLITQRNLPTFPRNPRKETKAKIEGARKEQRFLSPFPTSPKNRFFHFFSSYFLSHIYIYISSFLETIFLHFYVCSPNIYRSARKKGR